MRNRDLDSARHGWVIETAAIEAVMGVVFRPSGARGFFDAPLYELSVPLEAVWGRRALSLREPAG